MEHRAIPVALFNLQLRLHSLFCGAHRGESRAHGQTPSALAVLLRTPWRTSRLTIDQSVSMHWPCWSFYFCWCTRVHASMENLSRALRACALEQAVIALNLWVKASVVDGANARAHPLAQLHKQEPTRLRACMRAHARVHTRRRTQTHGDTRRHTHTHMSARAHTHTYTHTPAHRSVSELRCACDASEESAVGVHDVRHAAVVQVCVRAQVRASRSKEHIAVQPTSMSKGELTFVPSKMCICTNVSMSTVLTARSSGHRSTTQPRTPRPGPSLWWMCMMLKPLTLTPSRVMLLFGGPVWPYHFLSPFGPRATRWTFFQ